MYGHGVEGPTFRFSRFLQVRIPACHEQRSARSKKRCACTNLYGRGVEEPTSGLRGVHKSRSKVVISSALSAVRSQERGTDTYGHGVVLRQPPGDTRHEQLNASRGGCSGGTRSGFLRISPVPISTYHLQEQHGWSGLPCSERACEPRVAGELRVARELRVPSGFGSGDPGMAQPGLRWIDIE